MSAEEARGLLEGAADGERTIHYDGVVHHAFARDGSGALFHLDTEGDAWLHAAAPTLARTVIALSEERDEARRERDRMRDILACERGERAPEGWERNDFDPEAIGLAWYRSTGTGDSETPNHGDTVMWVYREPPGVLWTWEVERYDADGDNYCHIDRGEAPTALEAIEQADKAAGVERG